LWPGYLQLGAAFQFLAALAMSRVTRHGSSAIPSFRHSMISPGILLVFIFNVATLHLPRIVRLKGRIVETLMYLTVKL